MVSQILFTSTLYGLHRNAYVWQHWEVHTSVRIPGYYWRRQEIEIIVANCKIGLLSQKYFKLHCSPEYLRREFLFKAPSFLLTYFVDFSLICLVILSCIFKLQFSYRYVWFLSLFLDICNSGNVIPFNSVPYVVKICQLYCWWRLTFCLWIWFLTFVGSLCTSVLLFMGLPGHDKSLVFG